MHEHFIQAALLLASGSDNVRTALIAGLAVVLSTLIPALLTRREREPRAIRDLRAREKDLRDALERERDDAIGDRDEWKDRATAAERSMEQAVRGMELRGAEIERLRQLCVDNGLNPYIPKAVPGE